MKKTKSTLRRPTKKLTHEHFNMSIDFSNSMQEDELAITYYVSNLILLGQFSLANSIIEKHILPLRESSSTFMGNIRRMHGLCRLQKLKLKLEKQKYDSLQPESSKEAADELRYIKYIYKQAKTCFKRDGENLWGLALTYF